MNRFFALTLAFSLAAFGRAEAKTDPNLGVNRMGGHEAAGHSMEGEALPVPPMPSFSGNLPSTINEDRTHGTNAPGTMIGPAPENGEPDPRFPNDDATAGGGSEINAKSTSTGASQSAVGADKMAGAGGLPAGGTTSSLNEGLPSASKDNSGGNSGGASGGGGGGAGGTEYNAGGNARVGKGASQSTNGSSDVVRESAGAAPYVIGAIGFVTAMFLGTMVWARMKKRS